MDEGNMESFSETLSRRKDKPPFPRDRPPAPPPGSPKQDSVSETRPPLPLPEKHPKLSSPTETTPSNGKVDDVRKPMPIPQSKKATNNQDKVANVIESTANENSLIASRTDSISLSELTRGIGALRSVKGPTSPLRLHAKTDLENAPQEKEFEENETEVNQHKKDKPVPKRPMQLRPDNPGRTHRPVPILDGEFLQGKDQKKVEPKPIPAPRRTVRKPNGSAVNSQQDAQRKPLPTPKRPPLPLGEQSSRMNRPMIPDKKPQLSKVVKKTAVKQININMKSLKPNLIPVGEGLQDLYRSSCDILTLAEARVSENVQEKSKECVSIATSLLDRLSAYRDSLGPVTRMKVNSHITSLEEITNELKSFASELPSSPNAIELSRLSKMISAVVDVIATLSTCLPSL